MGIFSETTQERLQELEAQKKALNEAIEAEKIKKELTEDDQSIYKFFNMYLNSDVRAPKVRELVLNYFVDKIYVYNGDIIITCRFDDRDYLTDYSAILDAVKDPSNKEGSSDSVRHGSRHLDQCTACTTQCPRPQLGGGFFILSGSGRTLCGLMNYKRQLSLEVAVFFACGCGLRG